jgi:hypothetical protein
MPVQWRRIAVTTPPTTQRQPSLPAEPAAPAERRSSAPFRAGRFKLRNDERWAIIGKTGSGKSIFSRWIDQQYYLAGWPILIIDPKKRYVDVSQHETYATTPEDATIKQPYRIENQLVEGARVQIYLPTFPAIKDPVLNGLFFQALEHGGMVIHVEDMSQVATEHVIPMGMASCITDGRAAEIVMLLLAQQPVGIPTMILKQSENHVFFRMTSPDDRTKASKILGDDRVYKQVIPKRYFWYMHEGDDRPTLMSPLTREQISGLGGMKPQEGDEHGAEDHGTSRS